MIVMVNKDADGDEICDELEVAGCTDATACNYNENATDDDGSCEFAEEHDDCDGNCINDADGDEICDELEVAGFASVTIMRTQQMMMVHVNMQRSIMILMVTVK